MSDETVSPAPADTFVSHRYRLLERLGSGAMGVVYRALDRLTGQFVALKQVHVEADELIFSTRPGEGSVDVRLALANEFRTLASLRHPNVISVLDYGFDAAQQPYFAMEFLDHPQTIVEAGRDLSTDRRVDLLLQLLQALTYLHRRGILHRDLKPGNVLVSHEQVYVLDFGLATSLDKANTPAGTIGYLAPEVLDGQPASVVSDLYAAGVIAFEVLVGRHPFHIEDFSKLLDDIYATRANFMLIPDGRLAAVVRQLLALEPGWRYSDARTAIRAFCQAVDRPIVAETAAIRESFLQTAPLVGRDTELAALLESLRAMQDGAGAQWLIAGESGIGK